MARATKTKGNRHGYTSKVAGVYFRDDGTTRWVVRFRNEQGKTYRPQVIYPVDLTITEPSHPLHVRKAQLDAETEALRARRAFVQDGADSQQFGQSWTLGQLLERALRECEQGAITIKSVDTLTSNLRVWLGKSTVGHNTKGFPLITQKPLHKLTFHDFYADDNPRAFNNQLKARDGTPASNASVVKMLKSVQFVLKRARTVWGIKFTNPLPTLNIEVGGRRERVLTDKEWDAIITELRNASQATLDAIHFNRSTAVRRSEAVKLNWVDIDFEKKTAHLRDTKSKRGKPKERVIPIPQGTMDMLRRRYNESTDKKGPVFAHERQGVWKRIAKDTMTQAWTRARARAAKTLNDPFVLTARIHDLRHTRITEMGSNPNLTVAEIAKVSGHEDLRMFMRYFNPSPSDIGRKLDEYERNKSAKTGATASVDDAITALVALGNKDDVYLAFGKAMEQLSRNAS